MVKPTSNLRGLPTILTNRCAVFIVWRSLCTIPGKKPQLYTYLATLGVPSLVAEFSKVCTQFKEKPTVHLPRRPKALGTAFNGYRKTSYILKGLRKPAFRFPRIVIRTQFQLLATFYLAYENRPSCVFTYCDSTHF